MKQIIMVWKTDNTQAIDEGLKQRMLEKIEGGTFSLEDLQDYFTLFIQVANNLDETRDEVSV